MAIATPVNAVWQYRMRFTRAGQVAMVTTYLRNVGSPASLLYQDFCASILVGQEAAGGTIPLTRALLVSEWTILDHSLQAVANQRLVPFGRNNAGAGWAGTLVGTALPINTSVAIKRGTDVGDRHGYGVLKPPLGSGGNTLNMASWTAGFVTSLNTYGLRWIQAFVGNTTGDVLQPCIWSSAPGNPTIDFTTAAAGSTMRVARRRTVGVGK